MHTYGHILSYSSACLMTSAGFSCSSSRSRRRKRQRENGDEEPEPLQVERQAAAPRPRIQTDALPPSERLTITIEGGLSSKGREEPDDEEEMEVDEDTLLPRRMASAVVAVKPILLPSAKRRHRMQLYADDSADTAHTIQPMEVDGGLSVTVENVRQPSPPPTDLRSRLGKHRTTTTVGGRLQIETSNDGRSISVKRCPNEVTALLVKLT